MRIIRASPDRLVTHPVRRWHSLFTTAHINAAQWFRARYFDSWAVVHDTFQLPHRQMAFWRVRLHWERVRAPTVTEDHIQLLSALSQPPTLLTYIAYKQHTCEVCQAELLKAVLAVFFVVEHHSQGVAVLIKIVAPDHTQVIERETAELIHSEHNVACHFLYRLQGSVIENAR